MEEQQESPDRSTKPQPPGKRDGVSGRKFVVAVVLIGMVLYVFMLMIARQYGGIDTYFN